MKEDFLFLFGLTEEEALSILSKREPANKYRLTYTFSPFLKEKELPDLDGDKDKRVIRVRDRNGFLDILVGFFDRSSYND